MSELFMPVRMPVEYRAAPNLTEAALERINAATQKPLSAADITLFSACMATTELTDYATRLGVSTLQNFAADASEGRAYLREHRAWDGVFGYTFAGQYDNAGKRALASVYIVKTAPDPEVAVKRQQEAADIETGLRREVSVGFGGAAVLFKCDLCGQNIFSGDCPHLLGRLLEGKLQTATVENGRLMELSGVYKGACPGAAVEKATRMFRAQTFSAKDYHGWLDQYQVADPTKTILAPEATIPSEPKPAVPSLLASSGREGKGMKEKLVRMLSAMGLAKMAVAVVGVTDESPESIVQAMSAQVESEVKERVENHPLMLACSAAGIKDVAQLQSVLEMQALGIKSLADLRGDAKAEAIRAFGAEKGPIIGETVTQLSAEQVKILRDGWKAQADTTFGIAENAGASRASAGTVALPADKESNTPKTQWEQLTAEQQQFATKSLNMTDAAKREAYAAEVLSHQAA